jgi:hypothetical protein
MKGEFPIPFGGISELVGPLGRGSIAEAVGALMECGHEHNFAVQLDGGYLWTTALGTQCIQRAMSSK